MGQVFTHPGLTKLIKTDGLTLLVAREQPYQLGNVLLGDQIPLQCGEHVTNLLTGDLPKAIGVNLVKGPFNDFLLLRRHRVGRGEVKKGE